MRRLLYLVIILTSMLVLASCGSVAPSTAPGGGAAPTVPAAAAPTTSVAAPAPQISTVGPATPGVGVGTMLTGPIEFGALNQFTDPRGIVTIQRPQNWQTQDRSTEQELLVTFTDPTGNGVITARAVQEEQNLDAAAIEQELQQYLQSQLKDASDVQVEGATTQPDGSLQVNYSFTQTVNGKAISFQGQGFATRARKLIAFVLYTAPAEQWTAVRGTYAEIARGIRFDDSEALWSLPLRKP